MWAVRPADVVHEPGADGGVLGDGERAVPAAVGGGGAAGTRRVESSGQLLDQRAVPRDERTGVDEHDASHRRRGARRSTRCHRSPSGPRHTPCQLRSIDTVSELSGYCSGMADEVKTSRRAYHSPLRADQAQQTRRRVLESARRLFVERGYAGTTVAAVADRRRRLARDHLPLPRRQAWPARRGHGHHRTARHRRRRRHVVAHGRPASRRPPSGSTRWSSTAAGSWRAPVPIHAIIRGAADKEAFAAALGRRLLEERLTNQTERIRATSATTCAGTVDRRGRRAVLRARQPRPLPRAHRATGLDAPNTTSSGSPTCCTPTCSPHTAERRISPRQRRSR